MAPTVLVAFDESPQAIAALRHALATDDDASIHVLYVNDPWEWAGAGGLGDIFSAEVAFERSQDDAAAVIATAAEIAREYDTEITTATEIGTVPETIVAYAAEHDVCHIVLGSHGRRGLKRFLLGSVAEQVVRQSPVTVTIVREETSGADP
ncbi:universal stress protein [Natrinema salaciae]|uniref:Nucleotide-binding universal stress protein, UspA family n=1 Tax=Natrinema salaciae TaxID=1186196 RepID=A0A1H9SQX5_9EURY|nr:universal stress protein [Natrinema salaciae]SER87341.1 Nucleotide-binding universal stress protein, UspA family [Natrinema salaciae]